MIDFVGQQRRIFMRCRQFIFSIVKPFIFHLDKNGSVDYFPFNARKRQAAFVTGIGSAPFNDFRVEEYFDLSINTAGYQPLRDADLGSRQPSAQKGFGKKADH